MQIERIPFPPIGSNMYVVTQGRDAIVLDPWPDEATMQRLQGYHALIVLTHEHIDHISGLGRMQRALSARTLWQENCTPWLRNPGNTTPVLLAALSVSRGAPAPAMTMELICWESWLILPVNCLVMLRNGTRLEISSALPERLWFGTPICSSTPPTSARAT